MLHNVNMLLGAVCDARRLAAWFSSQTMMVQDTSQSGRAEAANSAGQLAEELEKVQKRLVNRDAAAKKYKEGCRTLKERVEQLQQVHALAVMCTQATHSILLSNRIHHCSSITP